MRSPNHVLNFYQAFVLPGNISKKERFCLNCCGSKHFRRSSQNSIRILSPASTAFKIFVLLHRSFASLCDLQYFVFIWACLYNCDSRKLSKSWCKQAAMKNQESICLSHCVATPYLQIMVQINLYFHKPEVNLIRNFMKHLERSSLKSIITYL